MIRRTLPKIAIIYMIILTTIVKCHLKAGWLQSAAAISTWVKVINDLEKLSQDNIRKQQAREHKQNNCRIVGVVKDQQSCLEDIQVRVVRLEAIIGRNC